MHSYAITCESDAAEGGKKSPYKLLIDNIF